MLRNPQVPRASLGGGAPETIPVPTPAPKRLRTPPKDHRKAYRSMVILAGVCVLAYAGIAPRLRASNELTTDLAALKADVPTVQIVTLSTAQSASDLTLPSNIQAIAETTINARTTGYMKTRFVDIGSKVKKGDLLAIVDSPEMDQQVGQSLAEVAKSQAGVSQAEADVSRGEAGVAASKAIVEQDRAGVSEANAQLAGVIANQSKVESSIRVAIAQRRESETRLEAAKADLDRAQSGFTIADKTLKRWKALFKQEAVPGQEVDEKQADFDSAVARVAAAKAGVSTAEADLTATTESVQAAKAELDSAKANVESARHKITSATASVDAASAAVQASYATVRAGTSGVNSATAVVSADRANAMRYQTLQGFERIVAPFSGVITARNVDEGDLVGPPSSSASGGSSDQTTTVPRSGLFGLANTDQLRIQLEVPQAFIGDVKQGQPADVLIPEIPGKVFHGSVFRLAGALDSQSRTLLVEVRLANGSGELKPGTYAKVRFKALGNQGITIPASTMIFDAEGTRVAEVEADDTVHFQTVVVGRDLGSKVEIVQGLTGHEKLISNPASTLVEGQKVKPLGEVN